MKIRIGTDLSLLVTLTNVEAARPIMIRSLTAYLVNSTLKQKADEELKNKTKFISRFPVEPMRDSYISTNYNINCSGYPTYNVWPQNRAMAPYAGFGYNPDWDVIYPKQPDYRFTEYRAAVLATKHQNQVEIHFPAEDQLFCGNYNIIIVVEYYMPGYMNNTKTVTLDYSNAFSIVESSEEEDLTGTELVTIKGVDNIPTYTPGDGTDVYVYEGKLDDGTINLNLTSGESVAVDVSSITAWHDE